MSLAAKHTYTPETPLGFINDDLAQLYGELNTPTLPPASHTHVEADITDLGDYATNAELTTALADYTASADHRAWISSQAMRFDSTATNPASQTDSLGGGRVQATAIYLWSNHISPAEWATGDKIKTTIYYALDTAGVASDVVTFIASGFGYDSGDAFTSPTVNWNETLNQDVSSLSADTVYTAVLTETSATIANDFQAVRINLKRNDAAYTYSNGVYILGVLLEIV
jgi:hypothetical protein